MKIKQITELNEGPVIDDILSKFGSKSAQGRQQTNQVAKKYSDAIVTAMARSGRKTISAKQLTNFLLKNNVVSQRAIDTVYAKIDMEPEAEVVQDTVVQDTAEKLPNQALQNLKKIVKQELKKRKKTPKLKRPVINDQTKSKVIKNLGMLVAGTVVATALMTGTPNMTSSTITTGDDILQAMVVSNNNNPVARAMNIDVENDPQILAIIDSIDKDNGVYYSIPKMSQRELGTFVSQELNMILLNNAMTPTQIGNLSSAEREQYMANPVRYALRKGLSKKYPKDSNSNE